MITRCSKADRLSVVIKRNNQVDLCLRHRGKKKEKANTRLFVLVTREAICVFERNKIQGKKVCGLLVLCQENMKKRLLGLICRLIKEQEYI